MIQFALDLTWVRHKIVGGTESFVNNLIKGFLDTKREFKMYLLCASDNKELFVEYGNDPRVQLVKTSAISSSVWKRLLWQNICMGSKIRELGVSLCLEPVYAKPILPTRKVTFLTVIHDLEALHYPENHSKLLNMWLRFSWWNSARTSEQVVCISDFVRKDILSRYHITEKNSLRYSTLFILAHTISAILNCWLPSIQLSAKIITTRYQN